MALYTVNANSLGTTDAEALQWTQAVSDLLKSIPTLTQVNDLAALIGTAGSAPMNFTQKTATGVTTGAASKNFSGTFSVALTAQDVGRVIYIPGAGSAGAVHITYIESVTSGTTGTLVTAAVTAIAGSGTAKVGIVGSIGIYAYGFEIFRFNDTEQTASPVFIKIIYGQTVNGYPILTVQVGQGTSGYGMLSGQTTTARALSVTTGSSTQLPVYISAAAGRINFVFGYQTASTVTVLYFSVCRSVDSDGATTEDYVHFISQSVSTSAGVQILPKIFGGSAFPLNPAVGFMSSITPTAPGLTASYSGNLGVFPVHPYMGRADNPCMDAVMVFNLDVAPGNTLELVMYGIVRSFLVLPTLTGTAAGTALAMRYE